MTLPSSTISDGRNNVIFLRENNSNFIHFPYFQKTFPLILCYRLLLLSSPLCTQDFYHIIFLLSVCMKGSWKILYFSLPDNQGNITFSSRGTKSLLCDLTVSSCFQNSVHFVYLRISENPIIHHQSVRSKFQLIQCFILHWKCIHFYLKCLMFFLKHYFMASRSIYNSFSLLFEMTAHINELRNALQSIAREIKTYDLIKCLQETVIIQRLYFRETVNLFSHIHQPIKY